VLLSGGSDSRVTWIRAETGGPAMPLHPEDQEWRDIAKQESVEMDPAKLTILMGKLCHALDERNEKKPQARYFFPAD
jgi:hypothetical protein